MEEERIQGYVVGEDFDEWKVRVTQRGHPEEGEKFIVELQKTKQKFFKDRTVYYSTFPIREQAKTADWNFELKAISYYTEQISYILFFSEIYYLLNK